jgi:cold shock protein
MAKGTIAAWKEERGFGFIKPDDGGGDVFFHFSSTADGDAISIGKAVDYDLGVDERSGKPKAVRVDIL